MEKNYESLGYTHCINANFLIRRDASTNSFQILNEAASKIEKSSVKDFLIFKSEKSIFLAILCNNLYEIYEIESNQLKSIFKINFGNLSSKFWLFFREQNNTMFAISNKFEVEEIEKLPKENKVANAHKSINKSDVWVYDLDLVNQVNIEFVEKSCITFLMLKIDVSGFDTEKVKFN